MTTIHVSRFAGIFASLGAGAWLTLAPRANVIGDHDGAIRMVRFILPVLLLLTGLAGLSTRHPARLDWAGWTIGIAACCGLSLVIVGQIGVLWNGGHTLKVSPALLPMSLLALGSLVYGLAIIGAPRIDRFVAVTLILGSPAPLFAFDADRGTLATVLWLVFGAAWLVAGLLLSWNARPALGSTRPTLCPRRYATA